MKLSKNLKYKANLHYSYFCDGYGLMQFPARFIGLASLATLSPKIILWTGFIGAIFVYFIGRYWYISGMKEAQIEVQNNFNIFVRQVRRQIGKERKNKHKTNKV